MKLGDYVIENFNNLNEREETIEEKKEPKKLMMLSSAKNKKRNENVLQLLRGINTAWTDWKEDPEHADWDKDRAKKELIDLCTNWLNNWIT